MEKGERVMTDDLVKRLRDNDAISTALGRIYDDEELRYEAADRIEELEAALREPTLPMLLAGKKSLYSCSEDPEFEDARACFLAMASKALEGKYK
jgi:hypothetical protein